MTNIFQNIAVNYKTFAIAAIKLFALFAISFLIETLVGFIIDGLDSKLIEFLLNEIGNDVATKMLLKLAVFFGLINQSSNSSAA